MIVRRSSALEGIAGWWVCAANASARRLFVSEDDLVERPFQDFFDDAVAEVMSRALADAWTPDESDINVIVPVRVSAAAEPEMMRLHVCRIADDHLVAQLTQRDGWQAVERMLQEQQRFRSALLELSELAHATEYDDVFYQRLIERAVEVVPGAQGGSIQLNIPGTTTFRFVAAVGYDLPDLQRHLLDQGDFFRDALDPQAIIVRDFTVDARSDEIADWLNTVGRLDEIKVNVSAPVLSGGLPVAFLALDNFEDPEAMTGTSVEMTTVLAGMIGELWRRRELEAELRTEREAFLELAMHDPLTGLANRRNLEGMLEETIELARNRSHPSAALFVDIEDFKGVNDRLGHKAGDQLLVAIASGLKEAVRAGDAVGRWGGDEFLVLPARVDSPVDVQHLAERILRHFDSAVVIGDGADRHEVRARLTIGLGWSIDSQASPDALVRAADDALYEAKAAGKGVARLHKV